MQFIEGTNKMNNISFNAYSQRTWFQILSNSQQAKSIAKTPSFGAISEYNKISKEFLPVIKDIIERSNILQKEQKFEKPPQFWEWMNAELVKIK